ncbi:MAG: hypothetical protein JJE35_06580 [Thermoleophilia bacterium]|nr:hypothetical protein [Thermoleophilia bacterium]
MTAVGIGTYVIGGGFLSSGSYGESSANSSYPDGTDGWKIFIDNISANTLSIRAYAICSTASAVH